MSRPIRVAAASAALLLVAVVALAVRGADDWSDPFTVFWCAAFYPAVLLGVIGVFMGALTPNLRLRERLAVLGLSLPAPAAALWLLWVLSQIADQVS